MVKSKVGTGGNNMVEFIKNIGLWFVEHKDEILLFFTSGNFMAFITAIVMFVRQMKFNKSTNSVSENLSNSLIENAKMIDQVTRTHNCCKDNEAKLDKFIETTNTQLNELNEQVVAINEKVQAIVEVQSLVYSTIKDESIRSNVQGILTNAKYIEQTAKAKLQEEISTLKTRVEEQATELQKVIETATQKVNEITTTEKAKVTKKQSVPRY